MPIVVPLLALGAAYVALRSAETPAEEPTPPTPDTGSEDTQVTSAVDWNPLIAELAGEIPAEFLVRWKDRESGGNPCSKGAWGGPWEAGIGQAYYERAERSSRVFGVTLDELRGMCATDTQTMTRAPTDEEMRAHVSQLVEMARQYIATARFKLDALSLYWSEEDVLCLAKLYHALPVLVTTHLSVAAQDGKASSWDDYRQYLGSMEQSEVRQIDVRAGYQTGGAAPYWPLDRLYNNAQLTGRGQ